MLKLGRDLRTGHSRKSRALGNPGRKIGIHRQEQPHPRIRPLVNVVVDQPGVPADRGPQPGGAEIGLGPDRVVTVTEMVCEIGQHLDDRDSEISRISLPPVRDEK